ncbi:hypothetical protein KY084_14025 [Stakelama sp. CBK3Z-3]|uniref:Glycosyltransferase RgtA/B/C/D-like domain-containing protein n=1 Tax=Stakelama flava TaxID=2860338 RepID=A0ABS6XP41_9SPHN|nr:hypothetical protein [Stakelama flava]MBW4331985.1 hypothetical protein [Stakelama flava]
MTRNRIWSPLVALVAGAALFALMLAMRANGYASASGLDLWGRTLLADDGLISVAQIVTAYPPLPYGGTLILAWLFPALGSAAPMLLAILLAVGLCTAWFASFRNSGFGLPAALLSTLFLSANPLFLRAVAEGPGFVLLHWGIWLLALGMFQLGRGHRVNDIILVAIALVIIVLSHPLGLVLAFAGLPFLALVVPADRLRRTPGAAIMVLMFPLLFTAASFAYVNWIFGGDPLHFIDTLSREAAGLGPARGAALATPFDSLLSGCRAAVGLFVACPIGVAMFARTAGMPPLRLAVLALMGWLVAATALATLFGLLPPLMLVVGLGVPFAAACALRWPHERPGRPGIVLLLFAGLVGTTILTFVDQSSETTRWRAAATGQRVQPPDQNLAALGALLRNGGAILFDAEAAPLVVAARGRASGIWSAETPQFQLAGLRGKSDAAILVVRNRESRLGSDRVGRLFPDLYERGRPGYRRIYDSDRWRAYARVEKTGS